MANDKLLQDLTLSELWEIADGLGIGGKHVPDKPYVIRLIKQRRAALAQADAQRVADARMAQAAEENDNNAAAPANDETGAAVKAAQADAKAKAVGEGAAATDAAAKLAAEHGLDLAEVEGTGKDGQVTAADVKKHLAAEG